MQANATTLRLAEARPDEKGSILRDAQNNNIGSVVVFSDVTSLRRLETSRRDFAANVSHEIRTPITSIKGYTETLLDGAHETPEDRERFLKIILRQVDRLNAIVEDILTLSILDTSEKVREVVLTDSSVCDVLNSATMVCEAKANEKI